MLAPSGVRHTPSLKEVKLANKGRKFPPIRNALKRKGKLGAVMSQNRPNYKSSSVKMIN